MDMQIVYLFNQAYRLLHININSASINTYNIYARQILATFEEINYITEWSPTHRGFSCPFMLNRQERDISIQNFHCQEPKHAQGNDLRLTDIEKST